ncbi:MAG: hypothetical protein ACE5OZ_07640 [Candidatus Heimdallarchaeota archaeon]
MSTEEDYATSDRDFYIGKTYSSYFAVALYGEDGIIKATCRNFRAVLDEMNKNRTTETENNSETSEDDHLVNGLEERVIKELLEIKQEMDATAPHSLNEKTREELERQDEDHQADVLAIVGMASALSQFSKESLGGGMESFETENGYKIYAERVPIGNDAFTLLFIPTKEGKHAFLESFIETRLRAGLQKFRGTTIREFINSFVGEVDRKFENEFTNLSLISQRLEAQKKVTHGGKPALLYAPSGVRYGYNLSREGAAFQSEMETIAKMGKELGKRKLLLEYGKRKLLLEDLGDCFLVTNL